VERKILKFYLRLYGTQNYFDNDDVFVRKDTDLMSKFLGKGAVEEVS